MAPLCAVRDEVMGIREGVRFEDLVKQEVEEREEGGVAKGVGVGMGKRMVGGYFVVDCERGGGEGGGAG